MRPFSEYHSKMQTKLFGQVLRAKDDDPLRQVSLLPGTANRLPEWKGRGRGKKEVDREFKRRSGKPRQNWLLTAKEAVWKDIFHSPNVSHAEYSHLGYGSAPFQELPAQDKYLYDHSNLIR